MALVSVSARIHAARSGNFSMRRNTILPGKGVGLGIWRKRTPLSNPRHATLHFRFASLRKPLPAHSFTAILPWINGSAVHLMRGFQNDQEERMTGRSTVTAPKPGDRVRMGEKSILFEVVAVNLLMRTASVKSTDGKGHVTRHVSWASLRLQAPSTDSEDADN